MRPKVVAVVAACACVVAWRLARRRRRARPSARPPSPDRGPGVAGSPAAAVPATPVRRSASARRRELRLSIVSPAQQPPGGAALEAGEGAVHSVMTQSITSLRRARLRADAPLRALVDAMEEWRASFLEQREQSHDPFWHRKSHKIVLSVLGLSINGELTFVRGCNVEVSMPSGSLCAERNALGTALSMYPALSREDFIAVAVLSLTSGARSLNPLPPCGVCSEWFEKIYEVNAEFRVLTFSDESLSVVHVSSLAPVGGALRLIKAHAEEAAEAERAGGGACPPCDQERSLSAAVKVVVNCTDAARVARSRRSIRQFQQMFQGSAERGESVELQMSPKRSRRTMGLVPPVEGDGGGDAPDG